MADDDITVAIEEEKPLEGEAAPQVVVNTEAAKTPDPVEELRAQKAELEAQANSERQLRVAAEQREARQSERVSAAEREIQSARTEVADSRLSTVETALSSAKTEGEAGEAAYAQAMADGNFAEAAKQQRRMARAEAEIVRLNEAKADLETQKIERPIERREQSGQTSQGDPVEAFIASRDGATQKWLRAHMEDAKALATDPTSSRAQKLIAADADADAEGYKRGSKPYFDHVERFLGMTQQETEKPNGKATEAKTPQRRSASAPVAPVNGGGSSGASAAGGTEVRLTRGEAQTATDGTLTWNYDDPSGQKRFKKGDVIGIQEMARRKKAMQGTGLYDPMNFIQQ